MTLEELAVKVLENNNYSTQFELPPIALTTVVKVKGEEEIELIEMPEDIKNDLLKHFTKALANELRRHQKENHD